MIFPDEIHRLDYAASVEVWELSASPSGKKEATLVGGLYISLLHS